MLQKSQERADKGSTRVLTAEAEEEIRRVLEKFPRLKGQQICEHLKENGFSAMTLSPRSVQQYIRNHDLRNPVYRQEKDRKAFEAEEFGDIWQADYPEFLFIPIFLAENHKPAISFSVFQMYRNQYQNPHHRPVAV